MLSRFLALLAAAFLVLAPATLLVVLPTPAQATLAVDSEESANTAHRCTTSPCTWSFTNTAGTEMVCGGLVDGGSSSSGASFGTVSYNGVSLSAVSSATITFNNTGEQALLGFFHLTNPATGTNTISMAGSETNLDDIFGGCITFTGQSGSPEGNPNTNSSTTVTTTASVTETGTTNGDIVISIFCTGTSFTSPNSPTVKSALLNNTGNTVCDNFALSRQPTSGGTVTAGWTTSSDDFAGVAVEVFAAAGAAQTPQLMYEGYGQ